MDRGAKADLDLTISIVAGGQTALTVQCLDSLLASLDDSFTFEIWLVDNCSAEPIGALIEERHPAVKVLRNARRMGFAANHNQILSRAQGRYVLILNDDVVVVPGACQKLIQAADSFSEGGFFGPRLLNPDGSLQPSAYRFPSPWRMACEAFLLHRLFSDHPLFGDYRRWKHDSFREVEFLSGAALMVRRKVVEQVGGFDERFYMYAEETDWCLRASRCGWKACFVPEAQIVHIGGQSTTELRPERSVEFLRSQGRFIEKYYGRSGLIVYKLFGLIKHIPKLAVATVARWAPEKRAAELDTVMWCLGMLHRPGLSELAGGSGHGDS